MVEMDTQRAILVAVDTGEYDVETSLAELAELAHTAGAEVLASVSQKRKGYDRATLVGSGRLEEIREFAAANEANLLIFDHELTASQIRNIGEKAGEGVAVIDRTMLILDIFARRAHTHEGRLQVELAQLRYRLPRLAGQGKALSRLGGGIGTRGPGETKLESDRRHIHRRIEALEAQLAKLENHRKHLRARRKKDEIQSVAIVGYTNVGKSTLLNALTDAGVLAEDMLLATLDPAARALALPDGRTVMLVDTVGLVRRLPHQLVRAFHSTLEEAALADLLLILCDISSPDAEEQIDVAQEVMRELGVTDTPMLRVLNQCDKTEFLPRAEALRGDALISAKTGAGLESLLQKIAQALPETHAEMRLLIPYGDSALLAEIRRTGKILEEAYEEGGIRVTALVDRRIRHKAEAYRI
ncbi:MAG: GTPase HflX [Clostridiales Family XIII bacterium]|jgi:GTP-binding protein HflX|nr:GTPase HflX [Clostridiales Family XIII bacterium]